VCGLNCKVFAKKILPPATIKNSDKCRSVEIFFAKPAGLDLARAVAAYLCIRFY